MISNFINLLISIIRVIIMCRGDFMYIDTHCHLSINDYDNIDTVINDNHLAGIEKIVISGCTKDDINESLDYGFKYSDVYVTIGYHPSEAMTTSEKELSELKKQILNNKVVGIGEIGLDYHYGKDDINEQKKLFRDQLEIARDNNLPVVIHSRDATFDTIQILKEFPTVFGVIHCFNGSLETAKEYISMGFKLGIGGVVTFKNSKLYKVIEKIGLDSIVFETDSPYLTPEPFRGKKNSSKYIPYISHKVAEILNISEYEVSSKVLSNTYEVFDLD